MPSLFPIVSLSGKKKRTGTILPNTDSEIPIEKDFSSPLRFYEPHTLKLVRIKKKAAWYHIPI